MTNQRNTLPNRIELELPHWDTDMILFGLIHPREEDGKDIVSMGMYVDVDIGDPVMLTIVGLTDRGELLKVASGYVDQPTEDWTNYASSASRIGEILRLLNGAG